MAQEYFDPDREDDPYSLPDLEVFEHPGDYDLNDGNDGEHELYSPGWYWWACFPGCLPDGDPIGPFETAEEALKDARGW